jgi:hypothetical protein
MVCGGVVSRCADDFDFGSALPPLVPFLVLVPIVSVACDVAVRGVVVDVWNIFENKTHYSHDIFGCGIGFQ